MTEMMMSFLLSMVFFVLCRFCEMMVVCCHFHLSLTWFLYELLLFSSALSGMREPMGTRKQEDTEEFSSQQVQVFQFELFFFGALLGRQPSNSRRRPAASPVFRPWAAPTTGHSFFLAHEANGLRGPQNQCIGSQ